MSNISVGFRVPPHLYEKLVAHTTKTKSSKSDVMISALATYLESAEDVSLSQRMVKLEMRVAALEAETNKYVC
jgi:predicted DNA-binding protein